MGCDYKDTREMRRSIVDRRARRLAALAVVGLVLVLTSALRAGVRPGSKAPPPFTLVPVAGRAWAVVATDGDNAGFAAGLAGVLLVDPFSSAEAARSLLARIRSTAGRSPRWLVRTRGSAARTAGEGVFIRAGAAVAGPGRSLDLGDSRAEISSAPVHPGGDCLVSVAPGDVVFAGELFEKNVVPDLADADADAWVRVLDGFLADHPAGFFVGARGQPGRALDVRYLRDYLAGLRLAVAQGVSRGESEAALADRLLAVQRGRFGRWEGFETRARRNIERMIRALSAPATTPR
jgi:hypothetical protein